MITPMDMAEWTWYAVTALVARWRVDTLRKARTSQLPITQR